MVQGDWVAIPINEEELVKGVADIAAFRPADGIKGIGHGQIALPDHKHQVGLVIQPVGVGVHGMAGADVEEAIVFVHPQRSGVKGGDGVCSVQAGLSQPLPVFGVFDHPDDLRAVALRGIFLAEDEEVVVLSGEETAPDGQFHRDSPAGQEMEIRGVVLHDDASLDVLHAGQVAGLIFKQVGFDCLPIGGVILGVDITGDGGGIFRCLGRSDGQRQGSGKGQKQRQHSFFHVHFSFYIGVLWELDLPEYFVEGVLKMGCLASGLPGYRGGTVLAVIPDLKMSAHVVSPFPSHKTIWTNLDYGPRIPWVLV